MILHQPAGRGLSTPRKTSLAPRRPRNPRTPNSRSGLAPSALTQPETGFPDAEAFSLAVAPHVPRLVSTARAYLKSEDLAWDAVQETLQRIWVRGYLPENPGGVLAHLVIKSCLHQRRCLARRAYHEAVAAEEVEPCCDQDPFAAMESQETVSSVREAVRRVSDKYRVVLERVDLDGESYQTIAEELDVPVGTIRSRLNRGRRLLREQLALGHEE